MRKVLGIVLGLAAAILIFLAVERVYAWLYPLPADLDYDDETEVALALAAQPVAASVLVVAGWFATAFGGGWLALRVCDWRPAGWIVALATLAASIAYLQGSAHALAVQAATVVAPIAGGWLAARLHHKPYPGEPLLG